MSLKLVKCPNCGATQTKYYNPSLVVTCDKCRAEYKPFATDNTASKFTFSSRKPTQQFIQLITGLLQHRQKGITSADLVKHNNQAVTFYSISEFKYNNMQLVKQTESFSDAVMIEIEPKANKMIIGTEQSQNVYVPVTKMELSQHNGQSLLHWTVMDYAGAIYKVVKLMSPDGFVQIKLIPTDRNEQFIHNVCELPKL